MKPGRKSSTRLAVLSTLNSLGGQVVTDDDAAEILLAQVPNRSKDLNAFRLLLKAMEADNMVNIIWSAHRCCSSISIGVVPDGWIVDSIVQTESEPLSEPKDPQPVIVAQPHYEIWEQPVEVESLYSDDEFFPSDFSLDAPILRDAMGKETRAW